MAQVSNLALQPALADSAFECEGVMYVYDVKIKIVSQHTYNGIPTNTTCPRHRCYRSEPAFEDAAGQRELHFPESLVADDDVVALDAGPGLGQGNRARDDGLAGLRGYTRARCYSSLTCIVTIGVLHIKEIGEGK